MQVSTAAAPGVSQLQKTLYNAEPIRGIEINNPTGSWLFVKGEGVYCPPYTIGWAITPTYSLASVDVIAGNGPAGQVGTKQGTNWELVLHGESVPPSAGVPYQFVEQFTPILSLAFAQVVPVSAPLVTTLLAETVGKRYRVWFAEIVMLPQTHGNPATSFDLTGNALGIIFDAVASAPYLKGWMRDGIPQISATYPQGMDGTVGNGGGIGDIRLSYGSQWIDSIVNAFVLYSVI